MTVYKRWENEGSRDRFSPHGMEHEERKWEDYRTNPMDKIIRFRRASHIWQSIVTKVISYKAIKNTTLSSVPMGTEKLNESALQQTFKYTREARY